MTNPPEDSRPGSEPGAEHAQPSQPASQYGAPQYGQQPTYPQQPQYGQPYGQQPYGQQPYGQPPYGTYPAQYGGPAKKSRTGLIVGLAVAALVIVAAAVLIPTALSYKVLDRGAVQRDVATQFQQRDGVKIDLTCPQRMKVSTGATYTCTGTTSQGEKVTLHIRITDENSAAYTWSER